MDMPALVGTFKDLPVLKGLHWTSQDPAGPDGGLLETGRCPLGTRWVPREPGGFPGDRVGSLGDRVGSLGYRVGSLGDRVGSLGDRVGFQGTGWVPSGTG